MINPVYPTIISNAVTAGNLLADTTTANAFIAPVGIDFSRYRGDFIEIYSGTTLWAQAWVSETAPGGESAVTDVLAGWDFTSGWDTTSATYTDANTFAAKNNGTSWAVQTVAPLTTGALFKTDFTAISSASKNISIRSTSSTVTYFEGNVSNKYFTAADTTFGIRHAADTIGQYVDVSLMTAFRVTSPSSTGALLLSSNGGSRGWAYKHASFNPNAAVTLRILARRIASGNGGYYK